MIPSLSGNGQTERSMAMIPISVILERRYRGTYKKGKFDQYVKKDKDQSHTCSLRKGKKVVNDIKNITKKKKKKVVTLTRIMTYLDLATGLW